jgi:hypothetical protein
MPEKNFSTPLFLCVISVDIIVSTKRKRPKRAFFTVGRVGFEPTRSFLRRILSPLRLPFRHHPRTSLISAKRLRIVHRKIYHNKGKHPPTITNSPPAEHDNSPFDLGFFP